MAYNKNNYAVAKVASKSTIRPEMACLADYGDRTIATDSFRLIEMSALGKKRETPKLYYADLVKKFIKVKNYIDLVPAIEDMEIKIPEVKATFPDVDQVLNKLEDESYITVEVNAELLEGILNVLKNVNKKKIVTLKIPCDTAEAKRVNGKAIVITAETEKKHVNYEQKARALLIPINR